MALLEYSMLVLFSIFTMYLVYHAVAKCADSYCRVSSGTGVLLGVLLVVGELEEVGVLTVTGMANALYTILLVASITVMVGTYLLKRYRDR
jgi:heme/copper-type cytochrome/quinol oxidase subunit 3